VTMADVDLALRRRFEATLGALLSGDLEVRATNSRCPGP